jgi:undecaprenyl phosphate N,N'-diacetylbacillosamine 1-phosphate transferase
MQNCFKRTLDVSVSGLLLFLVLPALLAIGLLVKLTSPGPALFRQKRLGRNGRPFSVLKFRTMRMNAPDLRNPDGSSICGENDPRVTAFGRFLRTTSLDELPQLWNVLIGDMSLVGPRPELVDQIRYYTEEEKRRLDVRPGLTGLAQISGRNSITWQQRKALDLQYVSTQSISLDLNILCRTIPYVLLRNGIHTSLQ